jgi:hypothetical protein
MLSKFQVLMNVLFQSSPTVTPMQRVLTMQQEPILVNVTTVKTTWGMVSNALKQVLQVRALGNPPHITSHGID